MSGLKVAFAALEGFPNRKGSGVRISQSVRALAAQGAEVTLLTLKGDPRPTELPDGVRHQPLKVLNDNYLARSLAFEKQVAQALYAERPDVVHVRGPFEGAAAAQYAKERKAAFIFEVNGLPSVELRYHHPRAAQSVEFLRKLRAQEQRLMRAADTIITQSQATARFVRLRAQADLAAHVIPNGATPELFDATPAPEGEHIELLYAGSLAPWQGLMDLLQALRQARREANFRLTVLGPARRAWVRAIQQAAKSLKVQDVLQIEAAGSQQAVAACIARAHICLAPLARDTRNRIQGCSPIKIFEYMAAGRAVLASDLPCVREILRPDETGVLHKASHPHRLRDALVALAADGALRQRLGWRARRWVQREATWTRRHAELTGVYTDLLSATARRASA